MVSQNDVQRLFLQSVISRRTLSSKLAKTLYEKSLRAAATCEERIQIQPVNDDASWHAIVDNINQALNPLDLELKRFHEEDTGEEMYAMVNGKGDDVAQAASDYRDFEIAYFKGIIDLIMTAPNESYSVSSLAALREASEFKTQMTKTAAENVLASFVARGWLKKSKRGRYSLTARTLVELDAYFKSSYPEEVHECIICLATVTRGYACPTAECAARMHTHCFNKYTRANPGRGSGNVACPTCSGDWGSMANGAKGKVIPVGEAAARDGQVEGRRRRRVTDQSQGADEGEEEEAEDTMYADDEPSQQSQPKKGKGKAKAKAKKVASDDEEEEENDDDDDEMEVDQPRERRRR